MTAQTTKRALLEDLQISKPLQLVEAMEQDGKLYMKGKIQQTSVNQNGRIYSKELWEKLFADPDYQHKLANGLLLGGIGHPKDGIFEPAKGCLVTREMELVNNDDVDGVIEILTAHPDGQIMEIYYRSGVFLPVSSRGRGDSSTDSDGNIEVIPGTYIYEGHDAVIEPSVKDATPEYVREALANPKNFLKYEELMREAIKVEKVDLNFLRKAKNLVPVTFGLVESGNRCKQLVSLMESKETELTGKGTPSKTIHIMDGLEIDSKVLAEAITAIREADKKRESIQAEEAVDINKSNQTNNRMAENNAKTTEQLNEEIVTLRNKIAIQEATAKTAPLEEKLKAAKALVEAQDKKIIALTTSLKEEKTKHEHTSKRLIAAKALAEAAINKAKHIKADLSESKADLEALAKITEAYQVKLNSSEKIGVSKIIAAEVAKFPEHFRPQVKKALAECKTADSVQAISESMATMLSGFLDDSLPFKKLQNTQEKQEKPKAPEKDMYEGMDSLTQIVARKMAEKQKQAANA